MNIHDIVDSQSSETVAAHLQNDDNDLWFQSVRNLYDYSITAPTHPSFAPYAKLPFQYEMLQKDGLIERVRDLADMWIQVGGRSLLPQYRCLPNNQNPQNVHQAEDSVHRRWDDNSLDIIRGYCLFHLKAQSEVECRPSEPLGIDDNRPQTVVFIALEDLNESNGFFQSLDCGQAICLDADERPIFPLTGGGRGVLLSLNL